MIRSMTAFGATRFESAHGTVSAEIRSVNNRYLDLTLRLPEELRFAEMQVRELVGRQVLRGKVELKLNYAVAEREGVRPIDWQAVQALAGQLAQARAVIPDIPAPGLAELPREGALAAGLDPDIWGPMCEQACTRVLQEFSGAREREGQRLALAMRKLASEAVRIVDAVAAAQPGLVQEHQERVAQRLREALLAASPEGFAAISGAELTARIAQEASLFGLRVDVAEELTRLRSHLQELDGILAASAGGVVRGSGKRLDFLFQEMNREANTLGSKAAALTVTRAAIDLKLLIEQLREQAQNIE